MHINVIGLGVIGLPTALLFAEAGLEVTGTDVDRAKLAAYRERRSPRPLEPDLAALLQDVVARGALRLAEDPVAADAYVIAVGTPLRDGAPDLAGISGALRAMLPYLASGTLVIFESTMPPGTTARLAREFGLDRVLVAHAPERVAPGRTLSEMRRNPRVVGGLTAEAGAQAATLYARICKGPIRVTDATTAEFVKLIENTYRDVNIALANELALLAGELEIDIWTSLELANGHPRVQLHRPGAGVGGHCIGVAPVFLQAVSPSVLELISAARRRNRAMPLVVARQVLELCAEASRPRVALLGLAYKPDVADDRDSPTHLVADYLVAGGAEVRIHDPLLLPERDLRDVLRDAHCMVVVVGHAAYRDLRPGDCVGLLAVPRVLDIAHVLERTQWERAGFRYYGLAQQIRSAAYADR